MHPGPLAWLYGTFTLVAIFLPAYLFVLARMPLWNLMRTHPHFQAAIRGVNAGVVGILLAALYDPIWTNSVKGPVDFSLALALFGMLAFWRLPPWVGVLSAATGARRGGHHRGAWPLDARPARRMVIPGRPGIPALPPRAFDGRAGIV
jgi:chromate transport protein ChrA